MSDPIQTYGMDKIDDLVVSGVTDERIDIPEEIQTQMADEIEPEPDIERDLDVLQRLDPNFINDPVRLYLREIAETPLLTHAQEIDLAKRVENGRSGCHAAVRARQPAPGRLDRQALRQPRPDPAGPDPGGQHRPDARGPEVRLAEGLPLLAPTPPGGFARRSPAPSPTRAAPSAFRSTWAIRSRATARRSTCSPRSSAASRRRKRWPRR